MRELTASQFVSWAEGYYGKYPKGQMADIMEYLSGFDGAYLSALKTVVSKTHESQYGKPPDIAVFDKAYRAACVEKDSAQSAIALPEYEQRNEQNGQECVRVAGELRDQGITQYDPHWITKVWNLRLSRGEYKQGPGGTIRDRNMEVRPFTTGAPNFGSREEAGKKVTAWDELGGN